MSGWIEPIVTYNLRRDDSAARLFFEITNQNEFPLDVTDVDVDLHIPDGVLPKDKHPALAGALKFRRENLGLLAIEAQRGTFLSHQEDFIYQIPKQSTGYFSVDLCREPETGFTLASKGIIGFTITLKNPVDGSDYKEDRAQDIVGIANIPPCPDGDSSVG